MKISFALVIAILGLVVYLITEKPKPSQIGFWCFVVGLLVWLLHSDPTLVTLFQ